MNPMRPFFVLIAIANCFFVSPIARGDGPLPKPGKSTPALIESLQGTWVGHLENDETGGEVSITIKGNSFRFHRDANFWFETTIALREETEPTQLLATIVRSAPSQDSSVGKVVPAIFKIEGGTMTIGAFADVEEPPMGFQDIDAANLYKLRLAPAKR